MPTDATPSPNFRPADRLLSRTYIGLLIAQFLAAFNDQAIHASAMFFAINTNTLLEKEAIALMPILFYAPWALFCTLAGYLADRYSKRQALVFWKVAEVAIAGIALYGFWLGDRGSAVGPWLVLSTVFLMGTHSAFFVPAKYGVMPEILQPHLLSKGNGLLESLSFLAVILGTVCGGVLSTVYRGDETIIGAILLALAVVGALASLLIRKMPAANPTRSFPRYLYQPLWNNLRTLLTSRPLAFAVIGIAFFTFVVAFMRATVYMLGESQNPRWEELKTSLIVGTVALGIGLGSPLAGFLSGRKIELGLVPLGATGMILACLAAANTLHSIPGLVACIVLIGFFTGFYIVPLFTLLQYRAPKTSKGDMIATSNFINVTGAITASLLFYFVVFLAQKLDVVRPVTKERWDEGELVRLYIEKGRPAGFLLRTADGKEVQRGKLEPGPSETPEEELTEALENQPEGQPVIELQGRPKEGEQVAITRYTLNRVKHYDIRRAGEPIEPDYDLSQLPRYLFLGAGLMTLGTLLILFWRLPDLVRRAGWLLRSFGRNRAVVGGLSNLPGSGPLILATNSPERAARRAIRSAADRFTQFFAHPSADPALVRTAERVLRRGDLIGVVTDGDGADAFLREVQKLVPGTEVLPVYCGPSPEPSGNGKPTGPLRVIFGKKLPAGADAVEVREQIRETGEDVAE